ncbi:MAG TPA: hypothetical protein VIF62_35185 [Labilithrix sp.]|jgi:hypothetical protein
MRAALFFLAAGAFGIGVVAACSSSSSDNGGAPDGGGDATPPPPPPEPTDGGDGGASSGMLPSGGSRIVARYEEGSDGSKFFSDLFDKKLNVTCNVVNAEDGTLRCIPLGNTFVSDRFSDDKCTTPIARRGDLCDAAPYATGATTSCGLTNFTTVYELGTTPITTTFYVDSGSGMCMPAAAPNPDEQYLALTRKLAPSELVGFTPHDETLTSALSTHVLVGDDGSRTLLSGTQLVDVARMGVCGSQLAADGMPRCLPPTDWFEAGFADMGCSMPVAFGHACTLDAGAPQFAADPGTSTECDAFTARKIHTIGALRPTRDWYHGTPGSCSGPAMLPDDLVDLGAEIPPTMFPAIAYEPIGGSRLVADTFHVGGVLLDRGPVRDQTTMGVCIFQTTNDGVTRCLPNQPATGYFYSDMMCMTPVANGDEMCAPAKYAAVSDGTCTPKYRVYALGTRADAASATLYYKNGTDCMQFFGSPGGTYVWPLGAEVPATTFVDVKLVEH